MTNKHHTINNIEFSAKNFSKLKAFYGDVFGWTFTEYGDDGPLVILYSENLEATEQAVKQHGGTISTPTFSFPGGRRFHFKDVEGNELAVWSE